MTIGEKIKCMREIQEKTQEWLSLAVGTTKQTIYKYENNIIKNIPYDRISAIAQALNTTPAYLMGWTDDPIDYDEIVNGVPSEYAKIGMDAEAYYKFKQAEFEDQRREAGFYDDEASSIFDDKEETLLSLYGQLSSEGQNILVDTADTLVSSKKYEGDLKTKVSKKFDNKNYDTIGAKIKKGYKDIIDIVALNNNMELNELVETAINEYIEALSGQGFVDRCNDDLNEIQKYVMPATIANKFPYIYKKDFKYLLKLRNRAEANFPNDVISEEDFLGYFSDGDGKIPIIKDINKLIRSAVKTDEYFWAGKEIYDILYKLVYQANINPKYNK